MGRKPAPPPPLAKGINLGDAVARYNADAKASEWADSTVTGRMVVIRAMLEILGSDTCTWDITPVHLQDVMLSLINGPTDDLVTRRIATTARPRSGRNSRSAVDQGRVALRHFARYMRRRGWATPDCDFAPADNEFSTKKKKYRVPPAYEHRIFEPQTWPILLATAEAIHPRVRLAVALGLYSGRRVSEIAGLRWTDLRRFTSDIRFYDVKNGNWVYTPLYPDIQAEIDHYLKWFVPLYGAPRPEWFVVASRKYGTEIRGINSQMGIYAKPGGWPLRPDRKSSTETINKDVRKLLMMFDGTGPNEGTGTHSWRRSAACFIADKYGLRAAQAFCGHASVSTTEQYTKNRDGYKILKKKLMKRTARPIVSTHQVDAVGRGDNVVPITDAPSGKKRRKAS